MTSGRGCPGVYPTSDGQNWLFGAARGTLRDLQMPAILLLVPDGNHDAGRFAALDNRDHLVRLRLPEGWVEELVATVFGALRGWERPTFATDSQPSSGTGWRFRAAHPGLRGI